jgi:ferric-dicitrate binding protein FerR (iron transport regulator)
MLTAQQYRVKAAEYAGLAETAHSASQSREFLALERHCTSLAANKDWLAGNNDQAVPRPEQVDRRRAEEAQILTCLGAAVIMRWATLPKKIQRELFDYAGSIGELKPTTEFKGQIARFLNQRWKSS